MNLWKTLIVICCLVTGGVAAAAESIEVRSLDEGAVSPPARIEALSWMTGFWEGEGLGGDAVEVIAPPAGGQMMGAFYHLKNDGALNFYEFYTFAEVGDTLVLRIKHFTPALIGWEEKDAFVEFPLVAVEDKTVYFDGLTFAMTGENEMRSAVNIRELGVAGFRFRRGVLEQSRELAP